SCASRPYFVEPSDSIGATEREEGSDDDQDILSKRPFADVLEIVGHTLFDLKSRVRGPPPAEHLCQPCNAWLHSMPGLIVAHHLAIEIAIGLGVECMRPR